MAKGNRTYKRDSRGRFASGGGGGGGSSKGGGKSKGTSTKSKNTARANELKAKGTTGLGARVKAKGFAGGKAAQQRAGGLKSGGTVSIRGGAKAFTVGKGGKMSGAQKASTKKATRKASSAKSRAAQAGKPLARTNKAPVSAAKARYKELASRARSSNPFRTAAENRKAAGAKRSLKTMIAKRGR